jgi:exodeoxyribonuclease V alpha subunit
VSAVADAAAAEPRLDASMVFGLPESSLLAPFNAAGVLAAADVHVARRLCRLGGDDDDLVALAAAFAVRAPRVGHVRVDLRRVRETAEGDIEEETDLDSLPWPDPAEWARRVSASPLVAVGESNGETDGAGAGPVAPLRLVGSALYLDRYWRDERAVAADLIGRAATGPETDPSELSEAIERLFHGEDDGEQRWAAAAAVLRGLVVIAGGPGTGKTTTVARIIGLLASRAEDQGSEPPLVALAAPTGKAANRMQEAVHAAAQTMAVSDTVRAHLLGLEAATVHRLLRARPDNASRFRHNRGNRLPHDLVIVDETSMLSLWLMARLVEAVRRDARLVLVGDPEQLASVEAGAVLGDVVGPAATGLRMSATAASQLRAVTGLQVPLEAAAEEAPIVGNGVVVLRTNHRFGGALADLATAIRSGDADGALRSLETEDESIRWIPVDAADADPDQIGPVLKLTCAMGERLFEAARAGDGEAALDALRSWRILCAHRRGPTGVGAWNTKVERWLLDEVEGFSADGEWYVGRPVIVTANDYGLRLFNGDTGVVVVRPPAGVTAWFERGAVSPSRLSDVDTVYAMTVHKAQGSEFERVALVLPRPTSRILTRELLYTAVTRAKQQLVLVGTEESVRAAVERPIARSSGLTERLWGS